MILLQNGDEDSILGIGPIPQYTIINYIFYINNNN